VLASDYVPKMFLEKTRAMIRSVIGATKMTAKRYALLGSILREIGEDTQGTVIITWGEYLPCKVT
jgi:hypothetical protein